MFSSLFELLGDKFTKKTNANTQMLIKKIQKCY